MKRLQIYLFFMLAGSPVVAQDFAKDVNTARSTYTSGDLAAARFAMEQMLSDVDLAIGKQILALLPTTLGTLTCDVKNDNVSGGSGAAGGLFVHRKYVKDVKTAGLDIINNSPLINSLNVILNTPLIGGMMRNDNQKVIRVQTYKSILTKNDNGDKTGYTLQIPFNNTLLTLMMNDTDEGEITELAGTLPLAKIAQTAQ